MGFTLFRKVARLEANFDAIIIGEGLKYWGSSQGAFNVGHRKFLILLLITISSLQF